MERAEDPAGARIPTGTWPLPGDATCARTARRLLGDALAALGVPKDTVADAALVVSELATNAHQHAAEHPPLELWLDRIGGDLWCAVFDGLPSGEAEPALHRSDFGRGLKIVAELAQGRWGVELTPSRLVPGVRGKVVWFLCPVQGW